MSSIDIEFSVEGQDDFPICEFTHPEGRRFQVVLTPDKQGTRFANALAKVLEACSEEIPGDLWPFDPMEE